MTNAIWHRESISKEDLAKLPSETFEGQIYVIQTITEAQKAVCALKDCKLLGFDTETKPSRFKGDVHNISLIQLSTDSFCFLFRILNVEILHLVKLVLEDENILKIGLSLKDDFRGLNKTGHFNPQNFIELQTYVKDFGIKDNGLSKIYANIFNKRISKRQRLSNWEADFLTNEQKKYAALDAWATRRIFTELENFKNKNNYIPKQEG
ncbi:MAG: 3'-5' exonuclease domain-containing protein 2 [Paludibacteraceae bacterium]|nr:3'-5' exonuclease domain-containing protein 2 [Paludibacteraceae bacterium]